MSVRPRKPATQAVHAGSEGVSPPLTLASVYPFRTLEDVRRAAAGRDQHRYYRRYGNLNSLLLEQAMAALEGTEAALATSAGMAAVHAVLHANLQRGDHVVASRDLYGGTYSLLQREMPRIGVEVSLVENSVAAIRSATTPATRAVVVETISNPLIRDIDLRATAKVAHAARAILIVDNTFATPVLCRPVEHGADVVIHSGTKFLGGHGDAVAGIACGPAAILAKPRKFAISVGLTASPMDAWLVLRGLRTVAVRVERAEANAKRVAAWLKRRREVIRMHYCGWGPMVSFDLKDGRAASRFIAGCRMIALVPSLGDVATTLTHPASTSHSYLPKAEREALGVGDGLIRLSVGIEDVEDILADLELGLRRAR